MIYSALFGTVINPESPHQMDHIYLRRTREAAGTLALEQANLYLAAPIMIRKPLSRRSTRVI